MTDYEFVVNYIEKNLPGFSDNVSVSNRKEYEKFKEKIKLQIINAKTKNECIKYLVYYVEYFNDNHTKIRVPKEKRVNEEDSLEVNAFFNKEKYKETEIINSELDELELKKYPQSDIRGIYQTKDSVYTVAVIENKTEFRDYVGIIIDSKTKLWKKGQVKFELRKKNYNLFEGFFYSRNHTVNYLTVVPFSNGILGKNWYKISKNERINYSVNTSKKLEFKIKDSIAYLRIPSFDGEQITELDLLYKKISPSILNTPYLIIDVRDNGGGNTSNAMPLIPFFYTNPIIDDEIVEIYATKDILKLYEDEFNEIMKDSSNVNKETIDAFREGLLDLKSAKLNTFVAQGEAIDTIMMKPNVYPKKVAILYNKGCASACEDLLFIAKKSSKTLLVGENSGGFVGYGNVFTIPFPCNNIWISITTTRYSTQREFEVVGIKPEFQLNYDTDWIQQTINILTKN